MNRKGIIYRAWTDTLSGLGLSDFSLGRIVLWASVSLAFVVLIWWWRGAEQAVTEVSDILLYGLAFGGAAFLPLFLWKLWLAPYKILQEKIAKLPKEAGITVCGAMALGIFNVRDWEETKTFKLGDAACLWVGVRPHFPINDVKAEGKFAQLSGALVRGDMPYNYGPSPKVLALLLEGKRPPWPEYSYPISAIVLRKYADAIGDVPPFLQSVKVPPELPPVEEEQENNATDA